MVMELWKTTVHGGIALVTDDAIITSPRFGDGNWRGGWWGCYDRHTGACRWRQKHRRGASLFDKAGNVLIATTHKNSGIYAFSFSDGSRLWGRLGDRLNWLLKLFDLLPVDNEGDSPVRIWHDAVLTQEGRLLNATTGKIQSRHALEYTYPPRTLVRIDGESVTPLGNARDRYCLPFYDYDKIPIEALLSKHGLELSSYYPCFVSAHGISVAVACIPPAEFATEAGSRLYSESKENVQHFLIVSNSNCTTILEQYDLGSFYMAELDWADDSLFSVTARTYKEFQLSYRRHLWVFEWPGVT
jgi:hypothetical protein